MDRFKDDATQSSTAEALKDGAAHGATLLARLLLAGRPFSRHHAWHVGFGSLVGGIARGNRSK